MPPLFGEDNVRPSMRFGECDVSPGIETLKEELLTLMRLTLNKLFASSESPPIHPNLRHIIHQFRNLLMLSVRR